MEATAIDPLAAPVPAQEPTGSAQELGQDEFLALLVAKLENQDPLQPAQDTEFVAQLATFSSLEQLIAVNENLEFMSIGQAQLINAQALGLIGKEALIEAGNTLTVRGGQPDTLVYAVPRPASEATLTIVDGDGQTVRTLELDPSPAGRVTLDWDGTDQDGNPLPDGEYTIQIHAVDASGEPMAIALYRSLRIDAVSFVEGTIALISGDREIPFDMIVEIRAGQG